MNTEIEVIALSLAVFAGVLICLEIGYRVGNRLAAEHPGSAHEGIGAIEAAVFGLLALLLGFSFSGTTARFDARRDLIVSEANAIGTAYLRVDLLPADSQPPVRQLYREYLQTRLNLYVDLADEKALQQTLDRSAELQQAIWSASVTESRKEPSGTAARLLLPAVNDMIDVTTARTLALHTHLPTLVFVLLIGVTLLSGLIAGYAMSRRKQRSWLHMVLYSAIVSVTIYVVLDLGNPRVGLIRLDAADQVLRELQYSIK